MHARGSEGGIVSVDRGGGHTVSLSDSGTNSQIFSLRYFLQVSGYVHNSREWKVFTFSMLVPSFLQAADYYDKRHYLFKEEGLMKQRG